MPANRVSRQELERVRAQVMPHLHRTPLLFSRTLSELAGCRVHLKQELFQKTGSYKPRGMIWALMQLGEERRARGVITFSAGNAAQGLAYASKLLKTKATIVMPATASPTKAQATRDYGAEVILYGTAQECLEHCCMLSDTRGLNFISSYDDMNLMTGHASLGEEIFEDMPTVRAIIVGVGGGGMAGGLVIAAEAHEHPALLYGIEPTGAPAMHLSLAAGKPVKLDKVATIADGLAAPTAGAHCFELVQRRFEAVTTVEDASIIEALKLLMSRCKLFVEPAGAAALAGLLAMKGRFSADEDVVCVISGGNLDFERLKAML